MEMKLFSYSHLNSPRTYHDMVVPIPPKEVRSHLSGEPSKRVWAAMYVHPRSHSIHHGFDDSFNHSI